MRCEYDVADGYHGLMGTSTEGVAAEVSSSGGRERRLSTAIFALTKYALFPPTI